MNLFIIEFIFIYLLRDLWIRSYSFLIYYAIKFTYCQKTFNFNPMI